MSTCTSRGAGRLVREYGSTAACTDSFCREMRTFLGAHGLEALAFDMELLARESLTNAIEHGNKGDVGKRVFAGLYLGTRWLLLRVRDQGSGFDHREGVAAVAPDLGSERGRGLPILRLYADRVSFNTEGNQVSIWKKLRREKENMSHYTLETNGQGLLVKLGPELTASIVPELKEALRAALEQTGQEMVFDFDQTGTLDSSGIGLLVATHNSLQQRQGVVRIVHVSPDIMRLLQSMRLDKRLNVTAK